MNRCLPAETAAMAFFSAVSSSIGKKLLLYGLRHIDILDKDPAEFVSVDVGKRTTLEVRDVGLHIKVCTVRAGSSIDTNTA